MRTTRATVKDASSLLARRDLDRDRADSAAWTACRALDDLRDESSTSRDYQRRLVTEVGLDVGSAHFVARLFDDRDAFVKDSAQAIAQVDEATTANLAEAHLQHLANPKTRTALMRSPKPEEPFTGVAGPLLDWIHANEHGLAKTVKGEAIARMDVYIRSGWAERDLGSQEGERSEAADQLRDLVRAARAGNVDPHTMKCALDQRWGELFVPLAVKKVQVDGQATPIPVAFESGLSTFSLDGKGQTEGGGRVDAFVRDAHDPNAWHMAFASSGEDSRKQGDQLTRHVGGVLNGIAIEAPPFGAQDRIASVSYYAPAILSEHRSEGLGLTRQDQKDAVNALALYAQLDDPYVRLQQGVGDAVLATRHVAIGSGATTQGSDLGHVAPQEHAQRVVGALRTLAQVDWGAAIHNVGEGPIRDTLLPLAQAAVDGLAKHYPETLTTLRKAVPHLNAIAAAPGIAETGQARDLRTVGHALKRDDGAALPQSKPLSDQDISRMRQAISHQQLRDDERGLIDTAMAGRVNAQDSEGNTALHLVAERRDLPLVRKLLDRGADATITNEQGQNPLHVACTQAPRTDRARADQAAVVDAIAQRSAEAVNARDDRHEAPLHLAASKGLDRSVSALLQAGADPTLVNRDGDTAKDLAQAYGVNVRSPALRSAAERTAGAIAIHDAARAQVLRQMAQRYG